MSLTSWLPYEGLHFDNMALRTQAMTHEGMGENLQGKVGKIDYFIY